MTTKDQREQFADLKDAEIFSRKIAKKQERVFLTLREVSDMLRIGYRAGRKLVLSGRLTAFQVSGQWRVYDEDLRQFVRKSCFQPEEKTKSVQ